MSWVAVRRATVGVSGVLLLVGDRRLGGEEFVLGLALGAAPAGGRLAKLVVGVVPGLRP